MSIEASAFCLLLVPETSPGKYPRRWHAATCWHRRPIFSSDSSGYFSMRPSSRLNASCKAPLILTPRAPDRSRRPLCCFVAEVLKGRWASALLGSFPVGPKTGVNFMLVEDSFANVVIFGQKTTQRRGSNGEVGLHLNHLSPLFHILLRFVFYSNAIRQPCEQVVWCQRPSGVKVAE